jgi:DNA (cytosine-5)-methyltransferase 1
MLAGWKGIFAVEKEPRAFHTLFYNLIYNPANGVRFDWPEWLPPYPFDLQTFRRRFLRPLREMRGKVTLVAGGLPCQGFSFAGERNKDDPRNKLFRSYIRFVEEVRPDLVLIENVLGIRTPHGNASKRGKPGRRRKSYAVRVMEALRARGYFVFEPQVVRAQDYGVPQVRPRLFIVAIKKGLYSSSLLDPFQLLKQVRASFLRSKRLPEHRPVSVIEAIGDLEKAHGTRKCRDVESPRGFKEGIPGPPSSVYQRLMRVGNKNGWLTGHRFARHDPETRARFSDILTTCRRGVPLSSKERKRFGLRKNSIVPLARHRPAHTLTTLPDDLLHYSEPRILTVREYARLQSFPDWFDIRNKFTTGGPMRKDECPRYTQVGNAVPPLLAEAMGEALKELLCRAGASSYTSRARKHVDVRGRNR